MGRPTSYTSPSRRAESTGGMIRRRAAPKGSESGPSTTGLCLSVSSGREGDGSAGVRRVAADTGDSRGQFYLRQAQETVTRVLTWTAAVSGRSEASTSCTHSVRLGSLDAGWLWNGRERSISRRPCCKPRLQKGALGNIPQLQEFSQGSGIRESIESNAAWLDRVHVVDGVHRVPLT